MLLVYKLFFLVQGNVVEFEIAKNPLMLTFQGGHDGNSPDVVFSWKSRHNSFFSSSFDETKQKSGTSRNKGQHMILVFPSTGVVWETTGCRGCQDCVVRSL